MFFKSLGFRLIISIAKSFVKTFGCGRIKPRGVAPSGKARLRCRPGGGVRMSILWAITKGPHILG
jgi:hypothetical protein